MYHQISIGATIWGSLLQQLGMLLVVKSLTIIVNKEMFFRVAMVFQGD
jgi:hypothetical protein